jgi:hypothetical protein
MHIRLTPEYFKKQLKKRGLIWDWKEDYISFPLNDPSVDPVTIHRFFTNDYLYLLDNWAQSKVFFAPGSFIQVQVIGDYAHALYEGNRIRRFHGENEFHGDVRFRVEISDPAAAAEYFSFPVIRANILKTK